MSTQRIPQTNRSMLKRCTMDSFGLASKAVSLIECGAAPEQAELNRSSLISEIDKLIQNIDRRLKVIAAEEQGLTLVQPTAKNLNPPSL